MRFGAPVKLGFENFTFLGVYILRALRVSVFADWWRPYGAFQGIRFEVSALATIGDREMDIQKKCKMIDGIEALNGTN